MFFKIKMHKFLHHNIIHYLTVRLVHKLQPLILQAAQRRLLQVINVSEVVLSGRAIYVLRREYVENIIPVMKIICR